MRNGASRALSSLWLGVALLSAAEARADVTVLTLDDLRLPDGTLLSDQYRHQGVLFSPLNGTLELVTASSPQFPGDPQGLAELPYWTSVIIADFPTTVAAAGAWINFGAFGQGLLLETFDGPGATGSRLASATTTIQDFLVVDAAGIRSVRFQSVGMGSTSFLIDHFTFETYSGTTYCAGDGSGSNCPCGNFGAPQHGCANGTFSTGAQLTGCCSASLAADALTLSVSGSAPGQLGLFFQGDVAVNEGAGVAFGDGLRCAGGELVRLEVVPADAAGSAASTAPIGALGGAAPGERRVYQWWYRDAISSPCGLGFNLSNGLEVRWEP